MHTRILLSALLACMLAISLPLRAQPLFAQLQQLPQLQTATILEQHSRVGQEKIYPLGSVRRISGRLRFTDEVLLRGEQHWLTLQLAPTHDAPEAFAAIRQQMQQQAASLLYWCQARDCGPSNLWANAVFANAQLYGPDEGQSYAVLQLEDSSQLLFVYAVTRGNGRPMLHLELFNAPQLSSLLPSADTLLRQLRAGEALELNVTQDQQQQWQQVLVSALRRSGAMQVEISGAQAGAWHERLLAAGIPARVLVLGEGTQASLGLRARP